MDNVVAESITLKTQNGGWLGQVVITSDGMFAAVTDYGNFSYSWRSFGDDFKKFLLKLDTTYFASKMYEGFVYVAMSNKIRDGAKRFSEQVLPALQEYLRSKS